MSALASAPSPSARMTTHAMARLEERYGVKFDRRQQQMLGRLILSNGARWNTSVLRFVARYEQADGDVTYWLLNLEPILRRPLWTLCVFNEDRREIKTFLPAPETTNAGRLLREMTMNRGRYRQRRAMVSA